MAQAARYRASNPPSNRGVPNLRGIYAITCIPNGRVYVGQARDFAQRWLDHQAQLIAGTHVNSQLQLCFRRWGPRAFYFQILEVVTAWGVESLTLAEQRWMNKYPDRFNVRPAGSDEYLLSGARGQSRMCLLSGKMPPVDRCPCGVCRGYRAKRVRRSGRFK